MKRLLVLGGTGFVGTALTGTALEGGWDVTVFNWDRRNMVPAGVRHVFGDRLQPGDYEALRTGCWDAVVDTWQGNPAPVRCALEVLGRSAGCYVYISSLLVHRWPPVPPLSERSALLGPSEWGTGYPGRKAACEAVVRSAGRRPCGQPAAHRTGAPGRRLIIRPGVVAGPGDPACLAWWLDAASDTVVLAPGPSSRPFQYVDVRDLAAWVLYAAEAGRSGHYVLACPPGFATFGDLLRACMPAGRRAAGVYWADDEQLLAAGVTPWKQLPFWTPATGDGAAIYDLDVAAAIKVRHQFRSLSQTLADVAASLTDAEPGLLRQQWRRRGYLDGAERRDLLQRIGRAGIADSGLTIGGNA